MLRQVVFGGIAILAVVALAGTGCGSSDRKFASSTADGGFVGGPDDSGILGNDGPQACSGSKCSSDLRSLVDCNGNVLMTCPPDQGCEGTGCVPACQAAIDSKGSIGCEFYAVDPDIFTGDGAAGGCFAAFVANTWDTPVTVQVDYDGQALDPSAFGRIPSGAGAQIQYQPLTGGKIPPGEVAILFLNRFGVASPPGLNINCPFGITPAITNVDAAVHGTGRGKAFHIKTDAPVSAYDILPYGGGQSALTSATLLLPTSAWHTNYVAVDAFRDGAPTLASPFIEVVAQEDNTSVTINPAADVVAGTDVTAAPKGSGTTYTLSKGQVLQLEPAQKNGLPPTIPSLTGSVIQSDHPVGVWGGKTSLGMFACCDDSAHQQIPPVRALGSEYVGVRYRNRFDGMEEVTPWG
ncbi:MAG TPA: IgGFc-binding protein, partial [Gemmataceae bacterium]|nr:IgGFc-binding protein [Gemmataceae bacterium]